MQCKGFSHLFNKNNCICLCCRNLLTVHLRLLSYSVLARLWNYPMIHAARKRVIRFTVASVVFAKINACHISWLIFCSGPTSRNYFHVLNTIVYNITTGVYMGIHVFILLQNIDCGYLLEPPRQSGFTCAHNQCFEQKWKYNVFKIRIFRHQENMSVQCILPDTPLLYSKTGVCRGIPIFLIFAQR